MLSSIFGPASPDTQVAPILKAHQDTLEAKIPDVLKDTQPKENPTELFQSYLTTGNQMFKQQSSKALDNLSMFANKAQTFAENFPDNILGNVTTYQKSAQGMDPSAVKQVHFSENGIPTAELSSGQLAPLDKVKLNLNAQPLQSLNYTNSEGQVIPVTAQSKLATAAQVKEIADNVNPDYTHYLLKVGMNEGRLNPTQRNYNFKDGTSSTDPSQAVKHGGVESIDRGIYQINNKAFPQITDQMADDPAFSTLWAISLIDAGKQNKWVSNKENKEMRVSYN